jgi:hypothetical protein
MKEKPFTKGPFFFLCCLVFLVQQHDSVIWPLLSEPNNPAHSPLTNNKVAPVIFPTVFKISIDIEERGFSSYVYVLKKILNNIIDCASHLESRGQAWTSRCTMSSCRVAGERRRTSCFRIWFQCRPRWLGSVVLSNIGIGSCIEDRHNIGRKTRYWLLIHRCIGNSIGSRS